MPVPLRFCTSQKGIEKWMVKIYRRRYLGCNQWVDTLYGSGYNLSVANRMQWGERS